MTDGGASITVEGDEQLAATLRRVADSLDDLPGAGQKAGQTVRQRAASGAPVDTGALSRSITATWTGDTVEVTASAPYAGFVEYGTVNMAASPYMQPAIDASTGEIVDAYVEEIQQKLETVKGA